MGNLKGKTIKPNRKHSPKVEIKIKANKKAGRQPDWGDIDTKKVCGTIPIETYDFMQLALATTHKNLKTQNKFINEAILSFLKNEE